MILAGMEMCPVSRLQISNRIFLRVVVLEVLECSDFLKIPTVVETLNFGLSPPLKGTERCFLQTKSISQLRKD